MRNITRKEVRRWTELGAQPGVVGEVRGHYRSNWSTELTWCYNRNKLDDCIALLNGIVEGKSMMGAVDRMRCS